MNWFVCVTISLHACVLIVLLYMCVVIFVCLHVCCIYVLCHRRTALPTGWLNSNQDETHYGVFPYANQRGNLSFIVCVKVKWVLCYFVIVSRPVAYVEYSKTLRRKAFTTAYFELHSCFAWVSDFQLQSNIVMAMGHQLLTINRFKACLAMTIIETTTPPWVVHITVTLPFQFLTC